MPNIYGHFFFIFFSFVDRKYLARLHNTKTLKHCIWFAGRFGWLFCRFLVITIMYTERIELFYRSSIIKIFFSIMIVVLTISFDTQIVYVLVAMCNILSTLKNKSCEEIINVSLRGICSECTFIHRRFANNWKIELNVLQQKDFQFYQWSPDSIFHYENMKLELDLFIYFLHVSESAFL
jgi:hypothetical protein